MAATDVLSLLRNVGVQKRRKEVKRDAVQITKSDLNTFNSFVISRELAKKFMEIQAATGETLRKTLWRKYLIVAWSGRRKPKNPRLRTMRNGKMDNTAIFQVKQFNGLREFEHEENPSEAIVDALTGGATHISRAIAQNFVYNEISCEPSIKIRPINELVNGHTDGDEFVPSTTEEKSAASKLILMITTMPDADGYIKVKGLTKQEMHTLVIRENLIKVKDPDGMSRRIYKYVKNFNQFRHIMEILKPIMLFSHSKFGVSDTEQERNSRMTEYAKAILGGD